MKMQNKFNEKIIWIVNLILFSFVLMDFATDCRFHITSGNNIGNFILAIVILCNLLIYCSLNESSNYNNLKIGRWLNKILVIIFASNVIKNENKGFLYNIVLYIIIAITYLICLKIIATFFNPDKNIFFTVIGIIGIVALSCIHYAFSIDKQTGEQTYTFENKTIYEKYKELYDAPESYIVLDYSDNSIYLRDLTWDITHFTTFDNKEEYVKFINEHTLGKDVFVPVLGGIESFNDNEFSITYWESIKTKTPEYMQTNLIYFYVLFMFWVVTTTYVGAICEKKNSIKS